MSNKNVAVIFGGVSSEHEVSIKSAETVILGLEKNNIIPIYITRNGKYLTRESTSDLLPLNTDTFNTEITFNVNTEKRGIYKIYGNRIVFVPVDIIFPVLHGKNGEDGTIQGMFEHCDIPYVGCGVLSSALCMDKAFIKRIVSDLGIDQAEYLIFNSYELEHSESEMIHTITDKIGFPCFIKPSNGGSSVGISKVNDINEIYAALKLAASNDTKFIVEKEIQGRELECAVLGNIDPISSCVGEIKTCGEFYDYDSKYKNADSQVIVPADIDIFLSEEIKKIAVKIYLACECSGLSRVDFFLEEGTDRIVFNEVNTLPGFTSISMYPMLWDNEGINLNDLCAKLIDFGFQRHENK